MDNRRNASRHTAFKFWAGRRYTISNGILLGDRALGKEPGHGGDVRTSYDDS